MNKILEYAKIADFAYSDNKPQTYEGSQCFWIAIEHHQAVLINTPNELIVSVRGTKTLNGWYDNFKFQSVKLDDGVKIHKGFYDGGKVIFKQIKTYLEASKKPITFVGHSAGGAKAAVMVRLLRGIMISDYDYQKTRLITFGAPKIGNELFNEEVMSYADSGYNYSRYTHKNDLVPYLPFFHGTHKPIDELRITNKGVVINPDFKSRLWGRLIALLGFKFIGIANHSMKMYINDLQKLVNLESR